VFAGVRLQSIPIGDPVERANAQWADRNGINETTEQAVGIKYLICRFFLEY
jgi:hypothetical protein